MRSSAATRCTLIEDRASVLRSRGASSTSTADGSGSNPSRERARDSSWPCQRSCCPLGPHVSGARVLVVDDEPQILRALQLKLRAAGYAVETASTAGEAVMKASLRPPEAIILDVLLPDGRGTDVCHELRGWSSAPILVLSAVGEEAEKIAALDAGADDYVTKPFSGDELLARLRAALRRTRTASQPSSRSGSSGSTSTSELS